MNYSMALRGVICGMKSFQIYNNIGPIFYHISNIGAKSISHGFLSQYTRVRGSVWFGLRNSKTLIEQQRPKEHEGKQNRCLTHVRSRFSVGAWCAGVNDQQQYIQVDFSGMRKVTKVSTQGRPGTSDYVSSYFLQYSADGTGFETHRTVSSGIEALFLLRVCFCLVHVYL